jgi:hypothetical protein
MNTATQANGSVRILRDEMASILGETTAALDVRTLAHFGSLLIRVASETRRGRVVETYRVEECDGGYVLVKGVVDGSGKWLRDSGVQRTIDTSFDAAAPRCDCEDARYRTRKCKHVLACRACGLLAS